MKLTSVAYVQLTVEVRCGSYDSKWKIADAHEQAEREAVSKTERLFREHGTAEFKIIGPVSVRTMAQVSER